MVLLIYVVIRCLEIKNRFNDIYNFCSWFYISNNLTHILVSHRCFIECVLSGDTPQRPAAPYLPDKTLSNPFGPLLYQLSYSRTKSGRWESNSQQMVLLIYVVIRCLEIKNRFNDIYNFCSWFYISNNLTHILVSHRCFIECVLTNG